MTDVLFGQSYYLRFDPKLWRRGPALPAAGHALRGRLRPRRRPSGRASSTPCWPALRASGRRRSTRERPRFAVLYEDNFNYLSKMCLLRMREAAFAMLAAARARGCTTIVAGSDATDHAEAYLAAGADAVLLGEGEVTLARRSTRSPAAGEGGLAAVAGLALRARRRQRPAHAAAPVHQGPRRAAVPGLGPRRRRPLPRASGARATATTR